MADETTKFPDSVSYSDDSILGSTRYPDSVKILNSLDETDDSGSDDSSSKFPTDLSYGDEEEFGSDYSNNEGIIDGLNNFKSKLTYGDEDYLAHDKYKDVAKIIDTLEVPHKNIKGYAFCA